MKLSGPNISQKPKAMSKSKMFGDHLEVKPGIWMYLGWFHLSLHGFPPPPVAIQKSKRTAPSRVNAQQISQVLTSIASRKMPAGIDVDSRTSDFIAPTVGQVAGHIHCCPEMPRGKNPPKWICVFQESSHSKNGDIAALQQCVPHDATSTGKVIQTTSNNDLESHDATSHLVFCCI